MKHQLLLVKEESERRRGLSGGIEIDDAYLGNARRGKHLRGSPNKVSFAATAQTGDDGYLLFIRFDRVKGFTHYEIERWSRFTLTRTMTQDYIATAASSRCDNQIEIFSGDKKGGTLCIIKNS